MRAEQLHPRILIRPRYKILLKSKLMLLDLRGSFKLECRAARRAADEVLKTFRYVCIGKSHSSD